MTPEQNYSSFDYLNKLNIQQLREILRLQLEEDEVNVELIKKINAVLASKTENPKRDVDFVYNSLRAAEGSDPLYSEIIDEVAAGTNPEEIAVSHLKARSFFRIGLVAAVIIVLFIGTGIVGHAIGFDFWDAMSEWTEDRLGFLVGDSLYERTDVKYPYYELTEAMNKAGIVADVVPKYMPSGYSLSSVVASEGIRGLGIMCTLTNNDREILLNYLVMEQNSNRVFTKDEAAPEVYTVCGFEHIIFTNEGNYIAVWLNQNVQCEIQGVEDKRELLKMIDSIYEE
ncbi:MAG: DUF4367 domain-containing protein [Faecousia sp.]